MGERATEAELRQRIAVLELLVREGDNHHNAAACPYCSSLLARTPAPAGAWSDWPDDEWHALLARLETEADRQIATAPEVEGERHEAWLTSEELADLRRGGVMVLVDRERTEFAKHRVTIDVTGSAREGAEGGGAT